MTDSDPWAARIVAALNNLQGLNLQSCKPLLKPAPKTGIHSRSSDKAPPYDAFSNSKLYAKSRKRQVNLSLGMELGLTKKKLKRNPFFTAQVFHLVLNSTEPPCVYWLPLKQPIEKSTFSIPGNPKNKPPLHSRTQEHQMNDVENYFESKQIADEVNRSSFEQRDKRMN